MNQENEQGKEKEMQDPENYSISLNFLYLLCFSPTHLFDPALNENTCHLQKLEQYT